MRFWQVSLLVGVLLALFVILVPVQAFEDPHSKPYDVDPDVCAFCHRSHTSVARFLTVPFYDKDRCFTCHDGTGSLYRTADEFQKEYHHSLQGNDVGSSKQCANCHETHKLESTESAILVDPLDTRVRWDIIETLTAAGYDEVTRTVDDTVAASGLYLWCEQCHTESSSTPVGSLLIESSWDGERYVPYSVSTIWKTSKLAVDDSGSASGYWDYFSSAFYNDTEEDTSIVGDSHGRSESTSTSMTWNGSYYKGYPAMPCDDCHENHGTDQPWLIVDTLTVGTNTISGYDMTTAGGQEQFCTACHSKGNDPGPAGQKCTDCHRHSQNF